MENVRSAMIAAVLAAALAPGCISVQVDWPGGKAKQKVPAESGTLPENTPVLGAEKRPDSGVKQAAAFLPSGSMISPSLPKIFGKGDSTKPATHILTIWRDKVEYLPDQTKNGAMGAGIVGQMFLYTTDMKFANADGTLTIEMFDETQKAGRTEPVFLGRWTFQKEVIRQLVTMDERWGKSYALFLPWPDYKADITRVKLSAKYEQEGGFTLYAPASTVTFNTGVPGLNSTQTSTMSPLGCPPPANLSRPGNFPAANAPTSPVNIPVGGNNPAASNANLPIWGNNPAMPLSIPIGGPAPMPPMMPANAAPSTPTMAPLPIAPTQPQGPLGLPPIATISAPISR